MKLVQLKYLIFIVIIVLKIPIKHYKTPDELTFNRRLIIIMVLLYLKQTRWSKDNVFVLEESCSLASKIAEVQHLLENS